MIKQLIASVFGTRHEREVQSPPAPRRRHSRRGGAAQGPDRRRDPGADRAVPRHHRGAHRCDQAGTGGGARGASTAGPMPTEREGLEDRFQELEARYRKTIAAVLDELLPEAFATVREACRRLVGTTVSVTGHDLTWDMVPYDVQLIGGIVLHQGRIAEMATGEGKTLVATLPLYLNALTGRGAHLVTVNNYLARRDSQWMGHVFTLARPHGRLPRRHRALLARAPRRLPRRHHLRHQQRVRLRLPARQHGVRAGAAGPARARLRDHRRGRLDPHRRGADAAHHLRARWRTRATTSTPSSTARCPSWCASRPTW